MGRPTPRRIVIGCPVFERAWVMNWWFDQMMAVEGDVSFAFLFTPGSDETLDILQMRSAERSAECHIFEYSDGVHSPNREWSKPGRIETMAECRNRLDAGVRELEPDYFLSVDSDVLVPANIMDLFELYYDVVAPLVYLGPSTITNAFQEDGIHPMKRLRPPGGTVPVDVVLAAKAVSWDVLSDESIRYGTDRFGEELQWCRSVRERGFGLWWASGIQTKHIMNRQMLEREDRRVEW